ncbi:serine/threonine-protein kinase [Glutamicibacter sp. FBE19]|uniref:serine/threonine-protein kinase n=1 Tax=Glutamicibacter sp. FBE19 TaxID=2761534 RepID=UPI001896501E|nr:serine/threonine-protein kinase [Glutamicibacter sp. FBE19]MBF6672584.1 serine/threonine protein kinase [Glutamicibacter sp. FBE19]
MTGTWDEKDNKDPWAISPDRWQAGKEWEPPASAPARWGGWESPAEKAWDPWGFLQPDTDEGWSQQTSQYTKKHLLARHGQGEVWLGELPGTEKKFAIKYLLTNPGESIDKVTIRRFEREVRAQSTLDHPGIMPVVYSNFDEEPPWFVMPLALGSLRDFFKQIAPNNVSAKLPEMQAVTLILEVAEALSYAHKEGVIHRDVKPENILNLDNKWVLSDFGLCRDHTSNSTTYTQVGAFGTYEYMAPEQYTDAHNATAAADIFAIGKVFFECLTGVLPYPTPDMTLVPPLFKYIITKCLNSEPTGRYVSVEAFINDLQALMNSQNDLALPIDHAQKLSAAVLAGVPRAISQLTQFVLANSADEIFLGNFLPSVVPPVMAAIQHENRNAFAQIVRAFDEVCAGDHPFSWTDSAARFLESIFRMSNDPDIRQMVVARILRLGTEHNRWAVRDIYVNIIKDISFAPEVLMVANQLAEYPEGAAFVRQVAEGISLPLRIQQVLAA